MIANLKRDARIILAAILWAVIFVEYSYAIVKFME